MISDTFPLTTDKAAFVAWLAEPDIGYDGGTDGPENPLAALEAAATMAPGCFIALATDDLFHEDDQVTELTTAGVATVLFGAQCRVFIDPLYVSLRPAYVPLAVNGAVDTIEDGDDVSSFRYVRLREEFGCQP